jgi:hypothetical protein
MPYRRSLFLSSRLLAKQAPLKLLRLIVSFVCLLFMLSQRRLVRAAPKTLIVLTFKTTTFDLLSHDALKSIKKALLPME